MAGACPGTNFRAYCKGGRMDKDQVSLKVPVLTGFGAISVILL